MHCNLASKVEQEPLSFEGAGCARPFRSSILLVPGSCGVFPLCEPTGIGHWNLLPVSIPSTLKSVVTGIVGRSYRQRFPGRTGAAVTYVTKSKNKRRQCIIFYLFKCNILSCVFFSCIADFKIYDRSKKN